jgi:uncharacterized membrane protein
MDKKKTSPVKQINKGENLAFGKQNYMLVAIAFIFIILGFILMSGSGTTEMGKFNPDIFSTRRIVIAPTVSLVGFAFMIYAILKNTNGNKSNEESVVEK